MGTDGRGPGVPVALAQQVLVGVWQFGACGPPAAFVQGVPPVRTGAKVPALNELLLNSVVPRPLPPPNPPAPLSCKKGTTFDSQSSRGHPFLRQAPAAPSPPRAAWLGRPLSPGGIGANRLPWVARSGESGIFLIIVLEAACTFFLYFLSRSSGGRWNLGLHGGSMWELQAGLSVLVSPKSKP